MPEVLIVAVAVVVWVVAARLGVRRLLRLLARDGYGPVSDVDTDAWRWPLLLHDEGAGL